MYKSNVQPYMYSPQHQMQQHPHQQHQQMLQHQQMQQRQMQMQHQHRMQQQQHMQHQQQILQARKQQVHERQQNMMRSAGDTNVDDDDDDEEYTDDEEEDEDEDSDDDDGDDEEDDCGDTESFSSASELLSSESESESESNSNSESVKREVTFESPTNTGRTKGKSSKKSETNVSKPKPKPKSKSKSRSKSKAEDNDEDGQPPRMPASDKADAAIAAEASTENTMINQMQNLAVTTAAHASIPSSSLTPGEYMFNVISDVLASNNKKNFQRILSRTPLPIALKYLHQIAQKAFATGNRDIFKVVLDTNKRYNIISDVYIDAFTQGESKSVFNAMTYLAKTEQAFHTPGAEFNTDELLKFFTPEFISMNLIQSGNIEKYDRVMTEFKNEEIRISRGFHVAKALIAAYTGVPKFFSNQKRYTFTREIVILAICGGSTETLDYVVKKTKMAKISHDIVLEARSCQPIPAGMMKHLAEKYNVSEMSL